jgi:hypothetical protein
MLAALSLIVPLIRFVSPCGEPHRPRLLIPPVAGAKQVESEARFVFSTRRLDSSAALVSLSVRSLVVDEDPEGRWAYGEGHRQRLVVGRRP